ncbi:MAG: peptidoglycan-binding protein [Candidatus Paceibacterota bacterium]|jgi:peptidoglycan hydrolase-like protein with peptidoglycan-binding domain
MPKRNFVLLIIVLVIAVIAIFGFYYFQPETTEPGSENENTGTNFISQFNPFGSKKEPTETVTPSVEVSGYQPPVEDIQKKLNKVSTMPVAGFTVFSKERLKEIPIIVPTTAPSIPYNFGSVTLKNGSTGEAVMEIQRFLNNTLDLSLELDGILDAEIITTIKEWQSNNDLVADGIVGAKTKAMMYSSVNQEIITTKPKKPLTEFASALRYVDRATGNIYQTFADKIEEKKFSATIIPKVHEAFFDSKGESVIMRYLKEDERTIETFVGTLPKELLGGEAKDSNEIKGTFLPNNIKDISMSPDGSKIFYLFNVGDSVAGATFSFLNNKKAQIFDSPFTEWLSFWPAKNVITLTTKPSANVPGYMYSIDGAGKNLTKVLGGINGLTTLGSPDGKLILYSDNNLSLNIYHTDTRSSDLLGIKTLPEKCIWNKGGKANDVIYCAVPKSINLNQYPDVWYQGEISFNDQIWKIDVKTGNGTMIVDPITVDRGPASSSQGIGEIDGIKLALDESENYLFFVNKKDSFLWKLDLE